MENTSAFKASRPVLLRFSTLTRDDFPDDMPNVGSTGRPDSEQLRAYISSVISVPIFREAMEVSSSSLGDTLRRIEAGEQLTVKKLLKTAISITRYMLRITGRPTPFGLQAGVTEVQIGDRARASFDAPMTKHVRIDAGWFETQAQGWLKQPRIRAGVKVVLNDLCHVRGDRLVFPSARTDTASNEVSVRRTKFVAWVCGYTRTPRAWADLVEAARERFPEAPCEKLEQTVYQLAANEFLLTSLAPRSIDADFIASLCDVLKKNAPDQHATFEELTQRLDLYRQAPLGQGLARWRELTALAGAGNAQHAAAAQVDLTMSTDAMLPSQVLDEVERCTTALWRMTQPTSHYSHMREYREAFISKYGQGGAVSLPDLIDPHRGLGFPRGYENPRVARDARLAMHEEGRDTYNDKQRLERLSDLIMRGMLSENREIALTDDDIASLATHHTTPPPPSLELGFQVLAESAEHLEDGDYHLITSPVGSSAAGASMGRFAQAVGITQPLRQLIARIPEEDGIVAQLTFRPRNARTLNVSQAPGLLEYHLPVGEYVEPGSDRVLDWRDLLVVERDGALVLVHAPTGRVVHPYVPNMLSLEVQAPNVARLMAEMRHSGPPRILQIWDWHGFLFAPWQPRVRIGKVILSLLTWRPSIAMREAAKSRVGWEEALEEWRKRHRVNDRVCVSRTDQTFEIDLRKPFHREMLRRELAQASVVITESPRDIGSYGWAGGRANEVVVPLIGQGPRNRRPVLRRPEATRTPHHPPGSDWFYAQVVAVPEVHDELICILDDLVGVLGEEVRNWHFVRYFSPEPHIRLRIRTHSPHTVQQVLTRLGDLQAGGMIREFRLCGYEPEVERYGGPTTIGLVEDIFTMDSRMAAGELKKLRAGRTGLSREVIAAVNHALLLDNLGSWDWPTWVGKRLPRHATTSLNQAQIKQVADFAAPGSVGRNLQEALQLPAVQAWSDAGALRELYRHLRAHAAPDKVEHLVLSLLHMQHNRLIGVDRASELRVLGLLRQIGRQHVGLRRLGKDHL